MSAPEALETRCKQCRAFIYHRTAGARVPAVETEFLCFYCIKIRDGEYGDARG